MLLGEKLEILIERRNMSKTEFAESVGITYRGLANYLNGSRKPKKEVLEKICSKLEVTPEFITDDTKSLILDSKERFVFNSKSDSSSIREAADYLEKGKQIFESSSISSDDKKALFSCLTELYFNSAKSSNQERS
ncbi:MAG: helix-turn-helix transcriptional regulator [Ruminiclostridium sp.]|nr:helix-turn-helix transcriptional regulator [Ruminiclostridium sp.]